MLMKLDILGKDEYVSASLASLKTGYSSDYIGQLCRLGKVPGRLVDRTWYVELSSLINYKQNSQLGRKRRQTAPLQIKIPANPIVKKGKFHYDAFHEISFSYENDNRSVLPTLVKTSQMEISPRKMTPTRRLTVLILSIIVVMGLGIFMQLGGTYSVAKIASKTSFLENLFGPINSIVYEQTGVEAGEYAALLIESIREAKIFLPHIKGVLR